MLPLFTFTVPVSCYTTTHLQQVLVMHLYMYKNILYRMQEKNHNIKTDKKSFERVYQFKFGSNLRTAFLKKFTSSLNAGSACF